MDMRSVIFYRTANGRSPVEEFLDGLAPQTARKVAWVLRLVEELDTVPPQYLKKLVPSNEKLVTITFSIDSDNGLQVTVKPDL